MSDIEKFLQEDAMEKRRTGNGVHYRGSKRGSGKSMRFGYSLMNQYQQRKYRKASDVEVWNMNDIRENYEKFKALTKEQQIRFLEEETKTKTISEIADNWGVTYKNAYARFNALNVKIVMKGKHTKKRAGKGQKQMSNTVVEPKVQSKIIPDGFSISLNGEYDAKEVVQKLEKMGLILDDENKKYKIQLNISEVE
ncbi:hypothetical protein Q9R38_26105 [Priestia aryabhattai]|uniref:hypothetical protein n=1 Tax=Priestia aryabhattai TaxID=412384 RepID=UPI0028817663|nr:hypothetical protein [Priestia aryabhattai]MDT0150018.1 hypothetical protein [Priestia aryabhattai]MDT0155588.1 hypothetical protein [Priestia aryabhattai]